VIALISQWNWTEVAEGTTVSVIFLLIPVLWRMRVHANRAMAQREEHHAEVMEAHRKTHEHLGVE
jgi:hypothetical protein